MPTFAAALAAAESARLSLSLLPTGRYRIESAAGWIETGTLPEAAARIAEIEKLIQNTLGEIISELLAVESPAGAVAAVEQIAGEWDTTAWFPTRHVYLRAGCFIALRHGIPAPFAA